MSEEKQPVFFTALISLFPLLLLLGIDLFALFLQPYTKAISHLAFAILTAQLLCLIVFRQGKICPGQRSRLIRVNAYLALFWGVWLLLSLFSNYHFVLTDVVCLAGIIMLIAIWKQPEDEQLRNTMLVMAMIAGGLGMLAYLLIFVEIPTLFFVQYSPFSQMLAGLILANLALVIAKNRLQGFIALLPFGMLIMLFCNALAVLVILFQASGAVFFANEFAFILYFILHLFIVLILAVHIFKQWTLSYLTLNLLLLLSVSLPVWSCFAYIQ
ncbi:hypothetical protein [Pasteurella sp. PK-2025]|uniref:hypothetical protein n=1 Tax=unclassified Pasteurella TaxID=2621516 RepID=UPI003C71B7D4